MTNNAVDPALPASFEESAQQTKRPKAAKVRKKTSKVLKAVLGTSLFILVILTIILVIQSFKSTKCQIEESVCSTQECTLSAVTLIKTVHRSEDPCEDFYSFVCGKGENATPNVFITLYTQLLNKLKNLLTKPNSTTEAAAISNAKLFYQECMDASKIQKLGVKPLKKILQDIASEWPWIAVKIKDDENVNENEKPSPDDPGDKSASNDDKENDDLGSGDLKVEGIMNSGAPSMPTTLEHLLGKLDQAGLASTKLFNVEVINDFNDWRTKRMSVDQYDPIAEINKQKRKKVVEDDELFSSKVANLITLITNNKNSAEIDDEILRMLTLKKQLEAMNAFTKERTNYTLRNVKMSIAELTELTQNKFNWLDYFNAIFDGISTNKLDESETIVVQNEKFFNEFPNIFLTYDITTIANLAVWNALIEPLLSHVYAPNVTTFHEAYRWYVVCVPTASELLPFAIGRLFTDTHTKHSILESSNRFIKLLRESYKDIISRSNWLDQTTKSNVMLKLDKMTQLVGFPHWIKNNTKLDDYYKDVVIGDDHVSNILSAKIANTKRALIKFGQNSTKIWLDEAGVVNVNAFYDPSSNSIIFPIGIIQIPFYEDNRLAAMNFGGVGSVIGHEIGHAFDNVGSQFDEKGVLWNLWSEDIKTIYEKKTQCYVDQYNDYCFQGTPGGSNNTCVDGLVTVGENAPDNIGMQAAFNAYNAWIKMHKKEKRLPGLVDFTPEQIFFISFAYIWCDNTKAEDWMKSSKNDPHSPGRYRVQGALSNFEEFAKAFKCKKGPMNRMNERCTLW
uniref:Peptidase M13 C-terminal domain-containing protein n=1 Tax=Strigamia maritima TaxID=126957 RepID=T1IL63_STRMM